MWGLREWFPFILKLKEVLMAGNKVSHSLTKPRAIGSRIWKKPERCLCELLLSCVEVWVWDTTVRCASGMCQLRGADT